MPTNREFHTAVEKLNAGGYRVTVCTPLRTDASRPNIGWTTKITFVANLNSEVGNRVEKIRRVTTRVSRGPSGLRRKLRYGPVTTEKFTIRDGEAAGSMSTMWDQIWTSASSVANGFSLPAAELAPLLLGCVEANEARPLADWLVENSVQIAAYLIGPGWLPATEEEFYAVRKNRNEEFKARVAEEDRLSWDDGEDDPDLDRWR